MYLRETMRLTDYLKPLTTKNTSVKDYWKVLEYLPVGNYGEEYLPNEKSRRLLTLRKAKVEKRNIILICFNGQL